MFRLLLFFFFFQAEDGIRDLYVTGVQTCALPISAAQRISRQREFGGIVVHRHEMAHSACRGTAADGARFHDGDRSEEHTSELQSRRDLVCRLLLEKKKN